MSTNPGLVTSSIHEAARVNTNILQYRLIQGKKTCFKVRIRITPPNLKSSPMQDFISEVEVKEEIKSMMRALLA